MSDLFLAVKFLFNASWGFFEIRVPGMSISFGLFFIGLTLAALGLRFVFTMVRARVAGGDVVSIAKESDNS